MNYNEYYSKQSVQDLLRSLRNYKISGNTGDKMYDELIAIISSRELTASQKELLNYILKSDVSTLKQKYLSENELIEGSKTLQSQNNSVKYSNNDDDTDSNKYPALRTISGALKVLSVIIGITTLVVAIYQKSIDQSFVFILINIIIGGLFVLLILAIAELIMLFIDIERNTRLNQRKG